jgi:hypothetical protein
MRAERRDDYGDICECYAVVKKEISRLLSDMRYRQGKPTALA